MGTNSLQRPDLRKPITTLSLEALKKPPNPDLRPNKIISEKTTTQNTQLLVPFQKNQII